MKKWVVIESHQPEVFCTGIYDTLREAVGDAYLSISEFYQNSYSDDGEEFTVSPLNNDDYGGFYIVIEFKAKCWDHSVRQYYYILESETKENDKWTH